MCAAAPCVDTILSPFAFLTPVIMAGAPPAGPPPDPAGSIGTSHGPIREPQPMAETLEGGSPLTVHAPCNRVTNLDLSMA
ncbi:hypothetical protein F511_25262 [Dorcoceras hygrometricum]|uniref:Uncharacterized protein n=1 Tax=Dorcoceras hygrometricum TaxID=472368 RepID=A0A2Z7C811_9LAMI|nr:hypothetical protein F511_25262 [Dorcoceras hygrometricum]